MRIVLMFLLIAFSFSALAEEDDKWKDVEQTIKQLERDTKTRDEIQKNTVQMNGLIRDALKAMGNGKKPNVMFKVNDKYYLQMRINEIGYPEGRMIPVGEKTKKLEIPEIGTAKEVETSLPKVFYALSVILYVFATVFFLFMAGYNLRYGNWMNSLMDLGIWAIASAIMWTILQSMGD